MNAIYAVDVESVPAKAGIYIFYRMHSSNKSALYVGKALNLKARVGQQMK
jgi:excinuclease UvrABC nuclease subunit